MTTYEATADGAVRSRLDVGDLLDAVRADIAEEFAEEVRHGSVQVTLSVTHIPSDQSEVGDFE